MSERETTEQDAAPGQTAEMGVAAGVDTEVALALIDVIVEQHRSLMAIVDWQQWELRQYRRDAALDSIADVQHPQEGAG